MRSRLNNAFVYHIFYRQTMQWDKLVAKELPPPWVPPIKDPLDVSNFDNYDEDEYVIEEYKSTGDAWDEDF